MPILVNYSKENIADITSKSISQFIASSLGGVAIGAIMSSVLDLSNFSVVCPAIGVIFLLNEYLVRKSL